MLNVMEVESQVCNRIESWFKDGIQWGDSNRHQRGGVWGTAGLCPGAITV